MNLPLLVILLLQSGVQAQFLARYFSHSRRTFWLFLGFFALILYPLDSLVPVSHSFFKNVLNLTLLWILCRILFPHLSKRKILLGTLLYWVPLPFSEVIVLLVSFLFLGGPPEMVITATLTGPASGEVFFLQLFTTVILWLFYEFILSRTRAYAANQVILMYILALLASLSCLAFLCICATYPQGEQMHYYHYPVVVLAILFFNVVFFISLHRYIRRTTSLRARQMIREEYCREVEGGLSRSNLRRFRHDVINALEQEQSRKRERKEQETNAVPETS